MALAGIMGTHRLVLAMAVRENAFVELLGHFSNLDNWTIGSINDVPGHTYELARDVKGRVGMGYVRWIKLRDGLEALEALALLGIPSSE